MTARTSVPADTRSVPGVRRIAEVLPHGVLAALGAASEAVAVDEVAVDVRADAYGHGIDNILPIAQQLGFRRFLVSDALERTGQAETAGRTGAELLTHAPDAVVSFLQGAATLRLIGEVLAVKTVAAGTGVSYGYTFRAAQPTLLALVGLGFADGIPRVASNLAPVRVGTVTGRIAGRIAMDQFVVALEPGAAVRIGDDAVLFGDSTLGDPTIAEWSAVTGMTAAELCTRLGARILRIVGGSAGE